MHFDYAQCKQKGFAPILVLVGIVVIAAVAGAYYLGKSQTPKSQSQNQVVSETLQPTTSATSPVPNDTGETASWKTFTYNNYMFEYPSGWDVRSFGNINDMNGVDITRVDKVIAITITNKQYPYGFEGPDIKFEKKTLDVEINGKVYKVNEVVVNSRSAFVDFSTDLPNKVFIKFGTGYPAAEDKKASLSEYNDSKEIILKILSTFRFD